MRVLRSLLFVRLYNMRGRRLVEPADADVFAGIAQALGASASLEQWAAFEQSSLVEELEFRSFLSAWLQRCDYSCRLRSSLQRKDEVAFVRKHVTSKYI